MTEGVCCLICSHTKAISSNRYGDLLSMSRSEIGNRTVSRCRQLAEWMQSAVFDNLRNEPAANAPRVRPLYFGGKQFSARAKGR